ncbi:MAG: ABC transporter ATP-binding protein, partial [Methanothrix sp.]|nr:ABC transporter ATP-binding protein [Methanothrix sp.]
NISVVVSTHYMPEAEMLCDRIAFLRKGQIVALDTPKNLKKHHGLGERVVVSYEGPVDMAALESMAGVLGIKTERGRLEMVIDRSEDSLDRIVKLFCHARILDITIKEPDVEDVFLELAR